MTREDLKTGMIVELANGNLAMVMGNAISTIHKEDKYDGGCPISDYNYDLVRRSDINWDTGWDIVKVYKERNRFSGASLHWRLRKENTHMLLGELIWERYQDETEEMTLEQICEELGRNIVIIK